MTGSLRMALCSAFPVTSREQVREPSLGVFLNSILVIMAMRVKQSTGTSKRELSASIIGSLA